jgi:TonB family protein
MLQPSQLAEVSARYPNEIAELRHFIARSSIPLDTPQTLETLVTRLHGDRTFRRDLKSHIWVLIHASDRQVKYSDLLGVLTIAAAGQSFAADADEADAHHLLRFLMEARNAFDGVSGISNNAPVVERAAETATMPLLMREVRPDAAESLFEEASSHSDDRRRVAWFAAAACVLLALLAGFWFHHSAAAGDQTALVSGDHIGAAAPIVSSSEASQQHADFAATRVQHAPKHLPRASMPTPSRERSYAPAPVMRSTPEVATVTAAPSKPSPATALPSYSQKNSESTSPPPSPGLLRRPSSAASRDFAAISRAPSPAKVVRNSAGSNPVPRDNAPSSTNRSPTAQAGYVRSTSLGAMAANVLYSPAPAYPSAATSLHVQGEVRLEAEVDSDGNVTSTRVISGPPLLQEAAVDAVQRWHYRPYVHAGKPIATNATVVMDFQLPSL